MWDTLAEMGPTTVKDLAERLGVVRTTARTWLIRLEAAGRVEQCWVLRPVKAHERRRGSGVLQIEDHVHDVPGWRVIY